MSTEIPGQDARREEVDVSFCHPFRPCDHLVRLQDGPEVKNKKLSFVGRRLFFLQDGDGGDPNHELNRKFLQKHCDHLERNRIMLVEGAPGSGKSALVEEIAMLYISNHGCKLSDQGEYEGGYAIATNGTQTLTELRLFSYRDGSVDVLGPLAQMQKDANEYPNRRYVFILHEYNRVADFMSVLGNALESELRSYGPDSWHGEESNKRHKAYSFGGRANDKDRIKFPPNLKIVLTSNPPRGGFAGFVGDFMADGALSHNRFLGAKVVFEEGDRFSLHRDMEKEEEQAGDPTPLEKLERGNSFPCGVIVRNLLSRFESSQADIREGVTDEIHRLVETGVNPGKIVAEIRRYCEVKGVDIPRVGRNAERNEPQGFCQRLEEDYRTAYLRQNPSVNLREEDYTMLYCNLQQTPVVIVGNRPSVGPRNRDPRPWDEDWSPRLRVYSKSKKMTWGYQITQFIASAWSSIFRDREFPEDVVLGRKKDKR